MPKPTIPRRELLDLLRDPGRGYTVGEHQISISHPSGMMKPRRRFADQETNLRALKTHLTEAWRACAEHVTDLENGDDPPEKRTAEERAKKGDTFAKAIALYHEEVLGGNHPDRGPISKRPIMGGLRRAGRPWTNWPLVRITPRDIKLRLQAIRDRAISDSPMVASVRSLAAL